MLAIAMLAIVLWLGNIDYRRYFDGAQFVHFLLGPATVVRWPFRSTPSGPG